MSVAFLYPGQGSQRPGMLRALPASPAVTSTLDEAAAELDRTRWPAGLDALDSAQALRSTTNAQLALLISGVAAARALTRDRGVVPEFVAGHSVGAFAAAVTAGVLTFTEAMSAVRLRGDLMEQICSSGQWGMAAVLGLQSAAVGALVGRVTTPDNPVWIANVNAANQIVVAGTITALKRAKEAAREAGARRWEALDVSIASHCPLQKPTAAQMAAHLVAIPWRPQQVAYLTNTGGRRVRDDSAAVLDDLAQAVARPVQWYDAMRLMSELGVKFAVQLPPGHALAALAADTAHSMHAVALEARLVTDHSPFGGTPIQP